MMRGETGIHFARSFNELLFGIQTNCCVVAINQFSSSLVEIQSCFQEMAKTAVESHFSQFIPGFCLTAMG
jgi:hypothetical protein